MRIFGLLNLILCVKALSNFGLTISPKTIGKSASYQISFTFDSSIPGTSTIQLNFPSDVSITDSSSVSCSIKSLILNPNSIGVSCSVASRVYTIKGAFGSSSEDIEPNAIPITITLPDITNPSSTATTSPIQFYIYKPDGTLAEYKEDSDKLAITADPGYFDSSTISTTSNLIGGLTSWTFSIATTYTITSGSFIQVSFPLWNLYIGAGSSDYLHFIRTTNPTSTSVKNFGSSLTSTYSTSSRYLKISGGFDSSRTGEISWTTSSIYNPPTSDAITGFDIIIFDSNSNEFIKTESSVTVKVSSPNIVELKSNAFGATSTIVSTSTTGFISFILTNPTYQSVTLEITFPSEIVVSNSATVTGVTGILLSGLTYSISSNVIKITNGWSSYSYKTSVSIKVDPVTTAPSTAPTSTFTVTTRSPNGDAIDTGTGGSATARAGTITQYNTNAYITATDLTVGSSSTYTFDMWLPHPVNSGGAIQIVFPSQITIQARSSTTSCTSLISGLSSGAYCSVSGQTLTVINGFLSYFSGGRIAFSIDQVTNPSTTATTSSFMFYSKTDSAGSYNIDTKTSGITFTASPALIKSVTVTPSSDVTGDTAVYTFNVETKNAVPSGGYVLVSFPAEITGWDQSTALSSCLKVSGFPADITCTLTSSKIKVTGFTSQFNAGVLIWTMSNIVNAHSTAPSSTFNVYTYDSSNNSIDQKLTGILVTLANANSFTSVSISPSSLINGKVCDYTFSIVNKLNMPSSAYVEIYSPSGITLPATPSCSIGTGLSTVLCISESANVVKATLSFSIGTLTAGSGFSFKINSVKNAGTTKPSETFKVYSFTSAGYKIEKKETSLIVTTTTAGTISQITIAAIDSKISASTSYLITYLPANMHPAGSLMYIEIPSELTLTSISCEAVGSGLSASTYCTSSGHSLTVSSAFSSDVNAASSVTLKINGLTNPSSQITTSAWSLITKTSELYLIDKTDSITSTFTCDTICLTCNSSPSICTSCNQTLGYPYLYDSSCHSDCKDGYADDTSTTDKLCIKCDSLCKTCKDSSIKCTSCDSASAYPYLYSDTCNSKCLSGYWGNGTDCISCTNPCETCSSASFCLSCAVSSSTHKQTFLLSGLCYNKCPDGYTSDSSLKTCEDCASPCKYCTDTINTCTSCESPYKLLGTTCVESCPTGNIYIETDSLCDPCITPCKTCSGNTVTCLSCLNSYLLFETSCVEKCPNGYANVNGVCLICKSPCDYCISSQTTCTTCVEGYLLQINKCVVSCDDGYYNKGIECAVCSTSCLTCIGSDVTCTSCANSKYLFGSECVESCPNSQYISIDKTCTQCTAPCVTCSESLSKCTSCTSGMYLYSNSCTSLCPALTTVASSSTGACEVCNTNCLTCSTTVDYCLSCESPKYIQSGLCVDTCSNGYYLKNNKCLSCSSICSTCQTSSNYCTSCSGEYALINNTCVTVCPQGYTKIGQICELVIISDCATGCFISILSNSDCDTVCNTTDCANDNGYCLRVDVKCGSNKYEKDGSCYNCQDPCSNCVGSSTYCTSCKPISSSGALRYLYNGNCLTECPDQTFTSGIICKDCDDNCQSCVISSSTCTSCVTGYKLYNNQCLLNCPDLTSVQVNSETCYECDGKCKQCSLSITNCTLCNSPLVLQDFDCVPYCNSNYFNDSGICKPCNGCKECEGSATKCTKCQSPLLLHSNTCVSNCPDGTYYGTSQCEDCGVTCATCSDKSSCDSCKNGNYLFENACIESCPSGYTISLGVCVLETSVSPCNTGCTNDLLTNIKCDIVCDIENCNFDNKQCDLGSCGSGKYLSGSECKSCVYPCQECESTTVCLSCSKSVSTGELLLLNSSTCIEPSSCKSGYTQVGVFCVQCSSECKECNKDPSTCVSCPSNKYLYNGTCISSCPAPYTVAKNSVCLSCSSNCLECEITYNTCTKCKSNLVLQGSVCQSDCNSGYTVTSSSPTVCKLCTNYCKTCKGETNICLSCDSEKFLYSSSCLDECPKDITIQIGNDCLSCSSPCKTCRNSISQCLTCVSGYNLHETKCLSTCPNGYEPRLGECSKYCAEGCNQTLLYNGVCDKFCNTEDCLYDNSMCLGDSSCAYGQYQLGTQCLNCTSPCNTCVSSAYCTSCILNSDGVQLLLYDGECYLNCPTSTYKDSIQCKACDSVCKDCSGSAKKCTSCPTGKKLYQDTCYSSCPVGITVEINEVCYDCDSNCLECASKTSTCTKCLTGLVLTKGTCKSQCSSGYTLTDSSPKVCVACVGCATCLNSEYYCLTCVTGKVIYENQCYSTCPSGTTNTTSSPSTCIPCDSNCKECKSDVSHCTSCPSGKVLDSYSECTDPPECPSGQTSDSNGVCQSCNTNCTECSGTISTCTKCLDTYFVLNSTCIPCSSSCLNCEESASKCTGCKESFYLSNQKCISCQASCRTCENSNSCLTCKSGLFIQNGACLECDSNCGECSIISTNCTDCKLGFYLSDGTCFECDDTCVGCSGSPTFCTKCSSGKYGDLKGICTDCSSSCKECQGSATNCTSCYSGKILINGVCDVCKASCASCVESFSKCTSCYGDNFIIAGECGKCQNNCKTCSASFTICTSCNLGYYMSGTSCLKCDSTCKTCSGTSSNCLSCDSGRSLIGSSCVICDKDCLTCANSKSECSSCEKGKYLSSGQCFDCNLNCTECFESSTTCLGCVDGFYLSGNECMQCSEVCDNCEIRADLCTSCPSGSKFKNGVCVIDCKAGTLQVGLKCEPCNSLCKTCIGSVDKCSSCSSGLVFNNSCVFDCPDQYFPSKGVCVPCSVTCYNCTEKSNKCTSCQEGYRLVNESCEFICPDGQYEEGGICLDCDSMCATCYKDSIKCTKCNNTRWVLMDDGVCTPPCSKGEVRVNSSRPCEPCDGDCKTCSKQTYNCTTCKDTTLYLYNGACIPDCPSNTTIKSKQTCQDCSASCKFCINTTTTCTLCPPSQYLLSSKCVSECPSNCSDGYHCIECKNDSSSSNSSNTSSTISPSGPSFEAKPVPFPFTGISFISAGLLGLGKLTSGGVQLIPSTIGLWSSLSSVSWVFLATYLPIQGESGDYRRLSTVEVVGGNAVLTVSFFLILGALLFHYLCNFLFLVAFYRKVYRNDRKYFYWRQNHFKCNLTVLVFCALVSFHSIRVIFAAICGYSGFNAAFDDRGRVNRAIVFYGYISVMCTFVPVFIAELLILTDLETYFWIWMFTLDSMIITFVLAVLIVVDIRNRESEMMKNEYEKKLSPGQFEPAEFIESSHSIKELIDMFPHLDITSLIQMSPTKRPIKKHISRSNPESPVSTPRYSLHRVSSFPLLINDFVEVKPETLVKPEPIVVNDEEPFGEEILNKSDDKEDLTMIVDEIIVEDPKEFEVSFNEFKNPISRPETLNFSPINIENKIDEYTEIVAFTEEDLPSEEEKSIEVPQIPEIPNQAPPAPITPTSPPHEKVPEIQEFDYENQAEPAKMSKKDLLSFSSSESSQEESKIFGHVSEEQDIELSKAIPDPSNQDLISVLHKPTGKRIIIKKSFKGARIVDLENKIIESIAPIDLSKYDQSKTKVDEQDVRFATMTSNNGNRVRVKRSFKGARIVDLEKKVSNPNHFLIGESIRNEADFQFINAYPDPDDPEVVVVMHNETGEDVKVRKTFDGAMVVDEAGELVPDLPGIDRNDYDIPKAVVDKDDVHLATLKHKVTNQKVKVRRNFRGAKIVDLERKADFPKGFNSISDRSDEPEPTSIFEATNLESQEDDNDFSTLGWILPSTTPKPKAKKPLKNLKLINIDKKKDDNYDRRKLANLANLIEDLEEDSGWREEEPSNRWSGSSNEMSPNRKQFYHNIDLNQVSVPDYDSDSLASEIRPNLRKPKRPRKKPRKKPAQLADSSRNKELEDIYLQRLELHKRTLPSSLKPEATFEPEWERTDSGFEIRGSFLDRTLPHAGEEIINPRFKFSTPRRD